MKRLITALLIMAALASAQVVYIPDTTWPGVRFLVNNNFGWLNTTRAGKGECALNKYAIQTTFTGVVCASLTSLQVNTALNSSVSGLGKDASPETYTILPVVDNGLPRVLQTRPNSESKRIVILGSSVARGSSASSYANSWAGKFEVAMTARGWTVINVSIGGHNTGSAINRFWTDVAPLKPDIVIHATGWANESFSVTSYEANIIRLVRMTEQIGAVPVVIPLYANSNWTAQNFSDAKSIEAWKVKLGIPTWDWLGVTGDLSTGHMLAGTDSGDGLHMNDVGHAAMFNAIPLSMFDRLNVRRRVEPLAPPIASWKWGPDVGSNRNPLGILTDTESTSWTVAAWFRDGGVGGVLATGFIGTGYDQVFRIRTYTGTIDAYAGKDVDGLYLQSTVSSLSRQWHHVAVTFQGVVRSFKFYVDGALIATASPTMDLPLGEVNFLANHGDFNSPNSELYQPAVYRTALSPDQIASMYAGVIPPSGIEWYSSLAEPPTPGLRMVSDVGTLTFGTVYSGVGLTIVQDIPFALTPSAPRIAGSAQPVCSVVTNGQIYYSGHATGVKDVVAVCASDATNTYAWRTIY